MTPKEFEGLPLWKRMRIHKFHMRYYRKMTLEEFLQGIEYDKV